MIAMAAAIAVVYPHMNSIGGDSFWLAAAPGDSPVGIQACGPAARLATPELYLERGHGEIPSRGPLAALTVAGTLGGWQRALELSRRWGGRLGLDTLLSDAIRHGRAGIPVSASQARLTRDKLPELQDVPGFTDTYLDDGRVPAEGFRLRQPALADTLEQFARAGLDDFLSRRYRPRSCRRSRRLRQPRAARRPGGLQGIVRRTAVGPAFGRTRL
jgi:oxamate amidohydrolase